MKNRFENLEVWQVSHQLALKIYKTTNQFPPEEKYRLGDQLRRSASSVPTNIVEGNSRAHKKEYIQFLYVAKGSLEETKYHLSPKDAEREAIFRNGGDAEREAIYY